MMPYNVRSAGGGSIGGILRKTGAAAVAPGGMSAGASNGNGAATLDARQPPLELLVFGYACKIFRDDEKARELDHGKQLIPWMGDVNLKIDRYDVRGALCDLAPYEAPPGGYGNRLEYLSAEEQRAEQLCEEERYLFLYNNEEELRLQQEEDLKRLQQETSGGNYSQVGFQYDGQGVAYSAAGAASSTTVPLSLSPGTSEENELPFVLPRTLLLALPPGMQVPETMKQHAIIEKTARFIATQGAQMEILIKAKQANNSQFDFLTQGGHLQPYYRHLLAAIKQAKFAPTPESAANAEAEPSFSSGPESHSQRTGTGTSTSGQVVIMVPTIKYKPSANCAYTQLISKIKGVPLQTVLDDELSTTNSQHSGGTASPTPSCRSEGHSQQGEFTPVLIRYNGSTFTHEAEETDSPVPEEESANDAPPQVELLKNTSALALAQNYSSESEDEPGEEEPTSTPASGKEKEKEAEKEPPAPEPVLTFPVPEESLRTIIDKTATYVIKNGRQFEETLRTKSVERFGFLLPQNEFYPYYLYKVTNDVDAASKEEKTRKAAAVAAALMSKKGLSFGGAAAAAGNAADKAPVCFSIRGRDDHGPLPAALAQEASDEEEIKAGGAAAPSADQVRGMPDSVQRAIKQVETQLLARSQRAAPISPQKDLRQAEERVKDKLALIARDKLNGMVSKEKQLQLERKRKAMAFLNQIKGASGGSVASSAVPSSKSNILEEAGGDAAGDSDNESNESVRSIPITYFGPDDDEDEEEQKPENDHQDDEEEEEDGGDLEKYNLLNDDSTNTFTSKPPPPPPPVQTAAPPPKPIVSVASAAVLLSDDDDVQLVPAASPARPGASKASRHRKTHRRSRSRSSSSSSSDSSRSSSRRKKRRAVEEVSASARKMRRRRSQSRTSNRSQCVRQSQTQSHRQKQRSRSRHRSRSPRRRRSPSQSRSRSRSSRSRSSSSRKERRNRQHREESRQNQRCSPKKSHKRHKRRRRSSSP
ncbi:protein suppressor of white apricot isoform X1 [Drosophila pseudoobscura]|uniref:Protein suppressor of white apricot isoform X1 n=1 Tax=Drosophila pseudoobscura pseudoobscura TaxID=46245 RepID=A0A6I8UH82_DROPS|nr:protein suppressor of white apricot isoform X1 [Drosophila pseudoobscura]